MSTSPSHSTPMSVPHLVLRVNDHSKSLSPPDGRDSREARESRDTPTRIPTPSGASDHTAAPSPSSLRQSNHRDSISHSPVNSMHNSGGSPLKRETPPGDEEVDELRDDEAGGAASATPAHAPPPPQQPPAPPAARPVPAPQPSPAVPSPKPAGSSGSKSRKSSCDLCHHRKIKCDQVRPSCSSCLRKGHPCHYSEETEANNPHNAARRAAAAAAQAQAKAAAAHANSHHHHLDGPSPMRNVSNGGSPAWMSSASRKSTGGVNGSRPASAAGTHADRKRRLDRERIVNGYGSSSDEEANGGDVSMSGGHLAGSRSGSHKPPIQRSVDNELADLVDGSAVPGNDDEVDELESGDEGAAAKDPRGKKRDASVDDELSGELLELASAPPKKKKVRPAHSMDAPRSQSGSRPRPVARHSMSSGLPPVPTAASGNSTYGSNRYDAYSMPLVTLMSSLPSSETQSILFNTFFNDPFLTEGIALLQPQFIDDFRSLMDRRHTNKLREGDATTLANAFAFLAVALRVLPEETGKLLLASGSSAAQNAPRSASRIIAGQPASAADPTPLDQRYFELALLAAQVAEQRDTPSVMYVVHKLVLFRYATLGFRKDKLVLASGWLAQAIKTAQALGMSKEWEGIPQGERELRRRVMWSLYVADRQFSFDTAFPYTILDAHQGIHLPSPISETDLYQIPPDARTLPPHSTEAGPTAATALFIHTHLDRRITPILDSFATVGPAGTPHDLVLRFDASLDAFQDALPPYLRLFPLTDTRFDSANPYLAPHRVRLHSTLLAYRLGVHRAHLVTYLSPVGSPGVRAVIAQVCLASLRCQKSAKMLDAKLSPRLFNPATVFEAAATLALIMYVERAVAGPSSQTSIAMSTEYLAMRAGVADGSELLDSVSALSEGAQFTRLAVRVLRDLVAKVDVGPKAGPAPAKEQGSPRQNGKPADAVPNGGPASPHRDTSREPAREDRELSERSRERERSPERSTASSNPYLATVGAWLDTWKATSTHDGINLDYLLKEADWASWEKVLAGM